MRAPPVVTKYCRTCGQHKPLRDADGKPTFYGEARKKDGLSPTCIVCTLDRIHRTRAKRKAAREAALAAAREQSAPRPVGVPRGPGRKEPTFGTIYRGPSPLTLPDRTDTLEDVIREEVLPDLRMLLQGLKEDALGGDREARKLLVRLIDDYQPPPLGKLERLYYRLAEARRAGLFGQSPDLGAAPDCAGGSGPDALPGADDLSPGA